MSDPMTDARLAELKPETVMFLGKPLDPKLVRWVDHLKQFAEWAAYAVDLPVYDLPLLRTKRKSRKISKARAFFWYYCRRDLGLSHPNCARVLGMNQSTVSLAMDKLKKRNPEQDWDELTQKKVEARWRFRQASAEPSGDETGTPK